MTVCVPHRFHSVARRNDKNARVNRNRFSDARNSMTHKLCILYRYEFILSGQCTLPRTNLTDSDAVPAELYNSGSQRVLTTRDICPIFHVKFFEMTFVGEGGAT